MLLNLIKRKKKKKAEVNNYDNYFIFYKYCTIKEFTTRSLDSKLKDLKEFKDKLGLFYYDTAEIKPDKRLRKKKSCVWYSSSITK